MKLQGLYRGAIQVAAKAQRLVKASHEALELVDRVRDGLEAARVKRRERERDG